MKVKFIVNNYTLGAKLRSTPVHKIVTNTRFDKSHTEVVYNSISPREIEFIEKVLASKGTVLE